MEGRAFKVRFAAGPRLAEGEKYWPWDEDCWGTVQFDEGAIRLAGKARMGLAGNLLTLGPLQPLTKPALARDLTEVVAIGDLVRVVTRKSPGKPAVAFRLYQRRDAGPLAVHGFVVGLMDRKGETTSDDAIRLLREIVPAAIIVDELAPTAPAGPAAGWYADPAGIHQLRYWDGASWTADVADDGVQSLDPLTPSG